MKWDNKRIQIVSQTGLKIKEEHLTVIQKQVWWFQNASRSPVSMHDFFFCFGRSDYHGYLNVWVFTYLVPEGSNSKMRWGGAGRAGGDKVAARAAWGLLGPTEDIVICNIHSNVPYQMQWVRCYSGMEISLVPHSALVTVRANSDKWIYPDNTYGTLVIQKDVLMAETVEGCEAERTVFH